MKEKWLGVLKSKEKKKVLGECFCLMKFCDWLFNYEITANLAGKGILKWIAIRHLKALQWLNPLLISILVLFLLVQQKDKYAL